MTSTPALRITLVVASHGEGGLENHVAVLARGLAARGHRVALLAHPDFASKPLGGAVLVPTLLGGPRWNPFNWYRLRRAIAATRPDVVHAQANKAALLVAMAACCTPWPLVASVHGTKRQQWVFRRFHRLIAVSGRNQLMSPGR